MLPWQYPLLAGIALLHDKSCLPALGLVEIFSEEPHDFETAKVRVGLLSTAAEASVVFDEAAKIFPNC